MIVLLRMPCNCVCATDTPVLGRVIECYWCGATFAVDELAEWLGGAESNLPSMRIGPCPLPLVRAGHRVLEVVGSCVGCGTPEVREVGVPGVFHLDVDASRLWN